MTPEADRAELRIDAAGTALFGDLRLPAGKNGVVVFAHGSGSSRRSPRNRSVASRLQARGLGTLLFDLLTPEEEAADAHSAEYRFNIEFLARRLAAATDWLREREAGRTLGYFGSSTGAAAALVAAANGPGAVRAIVSRGGRPDLAAAALERVRAPTLLIVGGNDPQVLELNRSAFQRLRCDKELVVIPGATHLFEEPGALEHVAEHAARWLVLHLQPAST